MDGPAGDVEVGASSGAARQGRHHHRRQAHRPGGRTALAGRGMDLVLSYRGSKQEAEQTVADVVAGRPSGDDCGGRRRRSRRTARAIVAHAVATFGRLDVARQHGVDLPLDAARGRQRRAIGTRDLDVNLRSAFLCAHAAIPHMRAAGGGRIVNFADWLARSGRPHYKGFTSYYVAKAGVIALTESAGARGRRTRSWSTPSRRARSCRRPT